MVALPELQMLGVAVLRDAFDKGVLAGFRNAAARCFAAIEAAAALAEKYRFSQTVHSVPLAALLDFGVGGKEDLLAPLEAEGLAERIAEAMGGAWTSKLGHSWARKKFAPGNAPGAGYHPQDWHQDGALGVRFPAEPGPVVPMTELLTCWIPLQDCGVDSPSLEFVRGRRPGLWHFSELSDAVLRRKFPGEAFWAPELAFGDGVVFTNDVLHRTWVRPEMRRNRLSVEYRLFPG
jgi:hypothetical protein